MSDNLQSGAILMNTPNGQTIEVFPGRAHIYNSGKRTCTIDISMDYETYKHVDEMELFNLEKDARGPGSEEAFNPAAEVEMEILLKKDIADFVMITADTEELFVKHLFSRYEKSPKDSVLYTENWYALNVKQDIDLPLELKALGTAKSGYRTEWTKMKEQL